MNHNGAVHELLIDFEKAYDSVRRETLNNILIGTPMKLVVLIKMCLNFALGCHEVGGGGGVGKREKDRKTRQ
jgi:hypothetical protein